MTLPGETEAGSAGMQPCRGIAWWAHRDDVAGRGSSPSALFPKTHRIGRPLCLENPRPAGAEYSLTESAPAPLHAEPEHSQYCGKVASLRVGWRGRPTGWVGLLAPFQGDILSLSAERCIFG